MDQPNDIDLDYFSREVKSLERAITNEKVCCKQLTAKLLAINNDTAAIKNSIVELKTIKEATSKKEIQLINCLDGIRNSIQMIEELKYKLKQELQQEDKKVSEYKSRYASIISKYDSIWKDYKHTYESFPIFLERNSLLTTVKQFDIRLRQFRVDLSEMRNKIQTLGKINKLQNECLIIKLAKTKKSNLAIQRNNLQLVEKITELRSNIKLKKIERDELQQMLRQRQITQRNMYLKEKTLNEQANLEINTSKENGEPTLTPHSQYLKRLKLRMSQSELSYSVPSLPSLFENSPPQKKMCFLEQLSTLNETSDDESAINWSVPTSDVTNISKQNLSLHDPYPISIENQSEKENINRNTNMFEESVNFDDQPHNESQQNDALISQQSKCAILNDNRENNSEINLEPAEIIILQGSTNSNEVILPLTPPSCKFDEAKKAYIKSKMSPYFQYTVPSHLTNKESQDTISNKQYSSVTTDGTHCLNIPENCQETVGSNNYNTENLSSSDFQKEIADPPDSQEVGTKEPGSLSQGKDGEDISSPASTQYYSQGTIEEDYNINNQENNLGEYYHFVSPPEGPQKNFQDGAESFVYPEGGMNYGPVSPADGSNSVDSYIPVLSPDVPMNYETWNCNPSDEPKSGFNFGGFNFGPTTGQSSNTAALFGGKDNQSKAGETNKANDGFNFNFDNKKSKTSSMFSLFS